MNKHHVVTTINSPTAITSASKGNFLSPDKENLILCKGSNIEVYSILSSGVKLMNTFSIYGVISKMKVFSIPQLDSWIALQDRATCSLFLLTDQNYFTILTYKDSTNTILTESSGCLEAANARVTDQPVAIIVDSYTRTILISAFTGFVFAIPFQPSDVKGKSKDGLSQTRFKPKAIRTNEFDFLSMVELRGVQQSSLAVLLGETNELKMIKSYKYLTTNEMNENERVMVKVESTTHALITVPDPIGGVLSVGEYIIAYHDLTTVAGTPKELSIDPVVLTAYTFLDNSYEQCVLGDQEGNLYMLSLEIFNMRVNNLSSTTIGRTCQANAIVDLGNQLLFISSAQGDPCIVRILPIEANAKYSIEIIHTFSNIGPIVDFCLFDYDQQGKQTMVCCSGVDKDGSLRIVENGDGFVEQAMLPIPLVKNFWTLTNPSSQFINTLLISTIKESFILKFQNESTAQEYQQFSALTLNIPTITTGVTSKGYLLHVTASSVRMVTFQENGVLVDEWKPPQDQSIAIARMDATKCVLCCGLGMLVYLNCAGDTLTEICSKQYKDIACIRLSSFQDSDFVLIGTWTNPTVFILYLNTLEPILEHGLKRETSAKDALIMQFDKKYYFMILLGDGQILTYEMQYNNKGNSILLQNERQTMLGTYCMGMHPYVHMGQHRVFISGTRPTIISSIRNTLYFSAVNVKDIYSFSALDNKIILMTHDGLQFGHIDTNQKLHHTKITLDEEMPIRIQYMASSKSLAVGTVSIEKNINNGYITRKSKIQTLDAQTFQVLTKYDLPRGEIVESMAMATFHDYPYQEFLFVGTVIENVDDPDASHGRILVFDVKEITHIELIEAIELPGIVYALKPFQNSVVACVNGSIYCLTKFQPDESKNNNVTFELSVHKNVLALTLDTCGDRVLVGDLMRSISVLSVTQKEPLKLDLLALDGKPNWMTAVKFVNDEVYIGADDRNNIFTVVYDKDRKHSRNSIYKLELQGGFHIGSLVNCFRSDTLADITSSTKDTIVMARSTEPPFSFATVLGSIGIVKTISSHSFEFFHKVQENILKEKRNIGELDYHRWRSYKPNIHPGDQAQISNFIDGDIISQYSTLTLKEKQSVIDALGFQYTIQEMEDLIHSLVSL